MIKFLLRFFLPAVILVCSGFSPGSSTISSENVVLTNLCYDSSHDLKKILLYDLKSHSFLSTDCNNPTVLPGGGVTGINYTGTNLYYTVTIPAGTHLNGLLFNTSDPDLVAEIISDCIGQTVMPPPFCDGGTFLIRVSSPAGNATTFDLNVDTYQFNITITPSDNPVCEGEDLTLQANVTGIPGTVASYAWSNGDNGQIITITDIMVAQAGVYVVTVTDDNGCTDTGSINIAVDPQPVVTIGITETSGNVADDGNLCNGDDITLTATGGVSYVWSDGSTSNPYTFTPVLGTSTYTVTATDANGCTNEEQVTFEVFDLPTADITGDVEYCQGDPVELTASGGVSYLWSNGQNTALMSIVEVPGQYTYTVTVTDVNGCTDEENYTVDVDELPNSIITIDETSGNNDDDGELCVGDDLTLTADPQITATGLIYTWELPDGSMLNNNPITITNVGLTHTGLYTVTVDNNGCTSTAVVTITVHDLPVADITGDVEYCEGDPVVLNATGGVTYEWNNGQTGATMTVTETPGPYTYTVTVTDVNGCTDEMDYDVEVFAFPTPVITVTEMSGLTPDDGIVCEGADVMLAVTDVNSDTRFEWDAPDGTHYGDASTSITGLDIMNIDMTLSGTYTVTAYNHDCSAIVTIDIIVNDAPEVEIQHDGSANNFEICEDEPLDLDATITGGSGTFTYDWELPDGTTMTGNPITIPAELTHDGTWTVTVTDANGCTGEDDIQVTVNPAPDNKDCGSAFDLGTGFNPINFQGNNICAPLGGPCANEHAVYFQYTVPAEGLTSLQVTVPGFNVAISTSCGGGSCEPERALVDCPEKGATYYITVSSTEANQNNFTGTLEPIFMVPDITGSVFVDLDMSGTFGGSDIPLEAVSVAAFPDCDENGTPIIVQTDANGNFVFQGLPAPPVRYLIMIDPNGDVDCDSGVKECVELDPCETVIDPILFPCPPPNCSSNPFSVDNLCDIAYQNPLCDLRVIQTFPCGQNPTEFGPWLNQSHCNGVYHNTSFYGFVAGSGDYDINFTIFACAGSGVQYGIMDVCSPGGPFVICNGNANQGTVTIPGDQLEPCKTYVFWIDGFSGSVCSYYAWVSGTWNNCSVPEIEDIILDTRCDPPCPSFDPYTLKAIADPNADPPIENITGAIYTWEITSPSGNVTNYTIEGPDGLEIEHTFLETGTYEVCLTTYHPCDGYKGPICREFTFEELPPQYLSLVLCTSDFPWSGAYDEFGQPIEDDYGNQFIWVGGDITLEMVRSGQRAFYSYYQNECGCDYLQELDIRESKSSLGKDSLAICKNQVPYKYHTLNIDSDLNDFVYVFEDITTKNGCDSVVSIDARILDMGGTFRDVCVDGGVEIKFNMGLQFVNADRDSIKFVWRDASGNVIVDNDSDSTTIVVPGEGVYSVDIEVFKYGKSCIFTFTHTVDLTGRTPSAPLADNWPVKICESSPEATYNVLTPDPSLVYLWTVPATATKIQDDSSGTLIVRWNGPVGGDICVKARNLCGDGPETCLPVVYVDQIDPDFDLALEVCKDDATVIVATSTHTATPVVYNWNFDGGNPDVPTNNGPGPHNVRWNTSGTKIVSLYVTENGCVGDPVQDSIEVKELPPPPIVSCGGTSSTSVTFTWTDVVGATSYNVQIINPSNVSGTITPGKNEFVVTGLALGQSVTIVVEAVIPGPCGNISSAEHTCTAEDCGDLPTITIQSIPPICLPGTPITLDESLVTVDPVVAGSTGSFTVNGTPATTFDPVALGPGTHTITYLLTWDNGRCSQSGTTRVVVNETPLSDFTVGPDGCVQDPVTVNYTGGTTGATYTWNFGPDVVGTYSGAGPHEVTWSQPGTKTITLTVSKNGCTSSVTTHTVTLQPLLTTPKIICFDQRIDGVTFSWDPVANASSYDIVVEIVGGSVLFQGNVTNTMYDVNSIPEGTIVRITVTAVSNNGCPSTTASHECKATSCPSAIIAFPKYVITECLTENLGLIPLPYTITNNLPGVVPTVTWTSNPVVAGAINNNTNPATFDPQKAVPGSYNLILTYQQKECIWSDSLLITLKPVPQASFTSEDKICISDALLVTYTGTSTNGRVLTWDDGGGVRTDLTATSVSYRFPAPGTYTIGLKVTLNGCESETFTKTIIVEDVPAAPVVKCAATSLDAVTFEWNAIPCATEYEVLINGVSKGTQTETTYKVDGLVEDEIVEIEVRAISTCECPVPPVTHQCQAKACPKVVINLSAPQTSICLTPNVSKIPLTATVTGNTPDGVGSWSGTGVDQNGVFDPAIAGVGSHVITYSYLDSTCPFEESITINVNELPRIVWEVVDPHCYNEVTGSFLFTIQGGSEPYNLTIDGNPVTISPAANIAAGTHTFVVTDANTCSATQDFTITIPPQPSFSITGPAILGLGKSATHTLDLSKMGVYANQVDSVVWEWNGNVVCSGTLLTCSSVTNTPPLGENNYLVTLFYNNGCIVTATYKYVVTDLPEYFFPNIINPNSKSGNTTFKITAQDPSLWVKKMRIYDRWGNLVYKSENFSAYDNPKGWDGRFCTAEPCDGTTGRDVVPGVYVYILEMESDTNKEIIATGDVTVIR